MGIICESVIDADGIKDLETAREVIRQLQKAIEALQREVADLRRQLEESKRAGKRQAGPFSKGEPKAEPKTPGQKPGHAAAHRAIPDKIDRRVKAELAACCDRCGGRIEETGTQAQYQIDMPRPIPVTTTQFDVAIGRCVVCDRRHQGRHVEQTSDALGAAQVQIGPNLLSIGTELKHKHGMSYGAVATFLRSITGCRITRSTFARADQRIAAALVPTYDQLIMRLRKQGVVYADETGWRVSGKSAWLWVFTSDDIALYLISRGRGHEIVERILKRDFKGVLKSDCWVAYDDAALADIEKSKCLGHLLRRCKDIAESKHNRAAALSKSIARLLKAALLLKQREAEMSKAGYAIARGRLEAALDRLLRGAYSDPDNKRLVRLLRKHRRYLFNFLEHPGCDGTNNRAEQAIRPSVIIRKTNGCNRSDRGALAHQVIISVIQSWIKQGVRNFGVLIAALLRQPAPVGLDFG
jgi:transposase